MGVTSVGHRLTILKSVYDVKKAQDVPIESDHYMPLSKLITAIYHPAAVNTHCLAAETEAQSANATLKDIKQLVEQLRLRDERMNLIEQDLRRMTEDFRRLREDMLPALRLAKDAQQPLPNVNNGTTNYEASISPPAPTPSTAGTPGGGPLTRKYSTKRIMLERPPKAASSPTHLQTTHNHSIAEQTLDPAGAADRAVLPSSHLGMNGSNMNAPSPSYPSPNIPSPTSPPTQITGTTLNPRSYRSDQPTPSSRSTFAENDSYNSGSKTPGAPRGGQRTPAPAPPDTPGSSNASVEIFKSFRVSMDDPCYKVLPAALKKYQINAPWDQYALYIVYGDQERCLGLEEKPLILFKQLDKEGKKPMFMLRKTNNAQADASGDVPGSAGLGSTTRTAGYDPPGGII